MDRRMNILLSLYLCFAFSWIICNSHAENTAIRLGGDFFRGYSGYTLFENSHRLIYYHDLTVSVFEIGNGATSKNCELFEVSSDEQRGRVLIDLERKFETEALELSFDEMIHLMDDCDRLESQKTFTFERISNLSATNVSESDTNSTSSLNILTGMIPGTKWCGPGNTAKNYFDLGSTSIVDKCCRRHDLCPTKILGNDLRYNLSNEDVFTRSHCVCDDKFFDCLKGADLALADCIGKIYFNFIHIPCIEEGENGKQFRESKTY